MDILIGPEVEKFIKVLEDPTRAKLVRTIGLLQNFGHNLTFPHSKKVVGKLFELRIRGKHDIRVFYAFRSNSAYLVHAFFKKGQKIPAREIQTALARLNSLDRI